MTQREIAQTRNPHNFMNLLRLVGLTLLTIGVYVALKIQGKLKM
jgi:hypothetical protein